MSGSKTAHFEMQVADFALIAETRQHFVEAIVAERQEPFDVGAR
jgi:hypothetical protein